ncbi:MAG: radical SAM protein [Actinobacteria bacterium]|nr:radical SAM protein [Actinomycetota bacterium]
MYFDQFGKVRACCQNDGVHLGDVGTASLREIWQSAEADRMRRALESDDYSVGCSFCAWQVDEGGRASAFARSFDGLEPRDGLPRYPRQMEFALSNTCNLSCAMCNGDFSSTIRSRLERRAPLAAAYGDRFFDELEEFLPHLERASFLGGEPFLATESLRVLHMLADLPDPPEVVITTNGTIATPQVLGLIETLRPHIVVSLDGATSGTYESIRSGARFERVMANLDRFIDILGPSGVSVAHCLMTSNWSEFDRLLGLAEERGLWVGVNVVRYPIHLSLYHRPAAELGHVVCTLRARNPTSLTDVRLATWADTLDSLDRHRAALRGGGGSSRFDEPLPRASNRRRSTGDDSRRDARRRAGPPHLHVSMRHDRRDRGAARAATTCRDAGRPERLKPGGGMSSARVDRDVGRTGRSHRHGRPSGRAAPFASADRQPRHHLARSGRVAGYRRVRLLRDPIAHRDHAFHGHHLTPPVLDEPALNTAVSVSSPQPVAETRRNPAPSSNLTAMRYPERGYAAKRPLNSIDDRCELKVEKAKRKKGQKGKGIHQPTNNPRGELPATRRSWSCPRSCREPRANSWNAFQAWLPVIPTAPHCCSRPSSRSSHSSPPRQPSIRSRHPASIKPFKTRSKGADLAGGS